MSTRPAETVRGFGATAGRSRIGDAALLALFAAALGALYFGLFNHDFSVNGLRYAGDVERGVDLFHPNHLLPNALYRTAWLALRACGFDLRAIWLMQAINACAGIAAAVAIARIGLRRAARPNAMLVAAIYAAGFAAWNFAEEPDVYILPAVAVAISLAMLFTRDALSWRAIVGLAMLGVLAVLCLQQYVFWYPALLALATRRDLGEARRAKLLALAIGVPLACLGAYLAVGAALGRFGDADAALGWFLGYAWNAQSGFGTYRSVAGPAARLLGTLLGLGNLAFAYEVILSRAALVAAGAGVIALAWVAAGSARALRRAPPTERGDAGVVFAWLLANVAFATWWESRNIEFLFPVWVAAAVLAARAAPALDRRVLGAALVLVAGVNLGVAFWPERAWPARYVVADALARAEHLRKDDVLITEELNTIGWLKYFDRVDVRFQPGAVSAAMHASLAVARVREAVDSALAGGSRVYTTELDEHGRLRAIARRFAPLGRSGFDGAVDRDIDALYAGFDVSAEPVPGARRVLPARR